MKQIFINLPVADLKKSKEFYTKLGFTSYPLFTGNNQICMAWSEEILVMLQSKEFFYVGSAKQIADSKKVISASFTLPVENIEKLNGIVKNGLKAGGSEVRPMIDEGFMQIRTIEDLDGHLWGIIHLEIDKFKELKSV